MDKRRRKKLYRKAFKLLRRTIYILDEVNEAHAKAVSKNNSV